MRSFSVLFIFIFLFSSAPVSFVSAQSAETQKEVSKAGKKKRNKRELKEKKRKEMEIQRAEQSARNKHLNIQSKDTKRRMKRNAKLTQAKRDGKKELFIVRWFRGRR
jgi:biopolymer transport protein ExbB/TolQ